MRINDRYEIRVLVAQMLDTGCYGNIYDSLADLKRDFPDAVYCGGFCVIDSSTGLTPDGCRDWCYTFEEALADYKDHCCIEVPECEDKDVTAFRMPNGDCVKVGTREGNVDADVGDTRNWVSLDVSLVHSDGKTELLCSIDYEDAKGLRTLVYDKDSDEPVYEHLVKGGDQ